MAVKTAKKISSRLEELLLASSWFMEMPGFLRDIYISKFVELDTDQQDELSDLLLLMMHDDLQKLNDFENQMMDKKRYYDSQVLQFDERNDKVANISKLENLINKFNNN